MSEYGIDKSQTITCGDGTLVSIKQLLHSSKNMVTRYQETEWTIVAFLLLLPDPQEIWKNRYGEDFSINHLLDILLAKDSEECVCGGAHRLFALSMALKIDNQNPSLGRARRKAICQSISVSSKSLEQSQTVIGGWTKNWYNGDSSMRPIAEMIVQTGHHLEWISVCPSELRPRTEAVDVAARFFLESVAEMSESELHKNYCGISHGVCGISNFYNAAQRKLENDVR